ncbi:MAG: tryptophan synthase subunit alpha [Thermoanaerobaculia bacterium]
MSRIEEAFARCRSGGRAAFIPYLTAGDPDLQTTGRLLHALAAAGADIVELGVPFSDPIADGPVNQRAAVRALAAGTTLSGLLDLVARERAELDVAIVLFSYYNPLYRYGLDRLAEQAAASGVDGILCVDLPPEAAADEWLPTLSRHGLDPIFLIAPTSTKERIDRAASASRGFVYYVSRTGVTGERDQLTDTLARELKAVRRRSSLPVAVGFGISTADQARAAAALADGVVIGSALVRTVEEHTGRDDLVARVQNRAAQFATAIAEARKTAGGWFGRRVNA